MEGYVPDGFKTAVVTPFIENTNLSADDLKKKNYCPVSDLSFILKLVERLVERQVLEHIHVHNLDNLYQYVFKTGHLTETAPLSIKNKVQMKFIYPCQEADLMP